MNNGEEHFSRKSDMENLSKIPVIENTLNFIYTDVKELKGCLTAIIGIKKDVDWLKKGFNWIAGITSGVIIAIVTLIFKR